MVLGSQPGFDGAQVAAVHLRHVFVVEDNASTPTPKRPNRSGAPRPGMARTGEPGFAEKVAGRHNEVAG